MIPDSESTKPLESSSPSQEEASTATVTASELPTTTVEVVTEIIPEEVTELTSSSSSSEASVAATIAPLVDATPVPEAVNSSPRPVNTTALFVEQDPSCGTGLVCDSKCLER